MEFIGEYLKNSRLNKKIKLKTVAEELNISLNLLKEIENNDFSSHLDIVYIIGHVRAYAKFLDLNDDEVVKQFRAQNLIDKRDLIDELPKPLESNNFKLYFATKAFSIFSIILISFGFYFLFIKTNDMIPNYSIIPDLPESFQSKIEAIGIQSTFSNTDEISSVNIMDEIISPISTEITTIDNSLANESSVIASISKNVRVNNNELITLKFIYPTWIQLRNKENQIIISKLMSANDEYSFTVADNYSITTGNAGNILVLIDGNTRGKVGKKGEVIDSLIINSDFNN